MIWENIALALSSIRSNKMRALLTMLGIIIGVASVIAIIQIGDAMTNSVNESVSSMGTSNLTASVRERSLNNSSMFFTSMGGGGIGYSSMSVSSVQVASPGGGSRMSGKTPTSDDLISLNMVNELLDVFEGKVAGVGVSYSSGSATVKERDNYANISLTGINPDYKLANSIEILSGRYITESDMAYKNKVAVVSDKLVNNMFGGDVEAALGQQVKVYKSNVIEIYTIIGVYKYEATGFMNSTASEQDISTTFYIPVTTAKQDLIDKNYNNITIVAAKDTDIYALTDELQNYFNNLYKNNTSFNVTVTNMGSMLDSITEMLGTITIAIAIIAGISLLVGGIGVMNIMLVSVTERTREIGTRKALGARNVHIRVQFITEAVIITAVGGLIGVALGIIIGAAISSYLNAPISISIPVILGATGFSMLIGVFFGLYPANNAAKMDPIDALRYE